MFGFRGKGKFSLKQEVPCKLEMEKNAIFGIFVVIISEHAFENGKFSGFCSFSSITRSALLFCRMGMWDLCCPAMTQSLATTRRVTLSRPGNWQV